MVPILDLSRRVAPWRSRFLEVADAVLASGHLLLGPELAAFEVEWATFVGRREAVGVASGASALQLALRSVGVGPGDEVLVPAFTAVPTAAAVAALGAVPVPVDVEPDTAGIDPAAAAAARNGRTVAIVPVHLYGRPVDLSPLAELGLAIIEDAAQAHGALPHGALSHAGGTGPMSAAACYSFYPTKNLGGVGDGGAVVTDDPELAERVRLLRVHGAREQYVHEVVAMNFRLSELEAAWLRLALPGLDGANDRRRAISKWYRDRAPHLRWHADHPDHVHHLCVVRTSDREAFRSRLATAGVQTGVHYPLALTQQPGYRQFVREECPQAEAWAAECVSLPCGPELTDAEVEQVGDALATVS